jgi:hypothetical protein
VTIRCGRRLVAVFGLAAALLAAVAVDAAPVAQQSGTPGAVYALSDSPHVWVADTEGVLHWVADNRALLGKEVRWSDRREVSVEQLRSFRLGDPWASAGLVKWGEPIYLAKWDTNQQAPQLLQVQSTADLALFGVTRDNYGAFVADAGAWEQRFGFRAETLLRGTLAPAAPPPATPTPAPTPTPTPPPNAPPGSPTAQSGLQAKAEPVTYTGEGPKPGGVYPTWVFKTVITISGAAPRTAIDYSLRFVPYHCAPDCGTAPPDSLRPRFAGTTDQSGTLRFIDDHGPYAEYTYTFSDRMGNSVSVKLEDDLKIVP